MNQSVLMQEVYASASLHKVRESLFLAKLFAVLSDIEKKVSLLGILKDKVNEFTVFAPAVEPYDVGVSQSLMDVNFPHQSSFNFLIGQATL
jgi:hypothetical protein